MSNCAEFYNEILNRIRIMSDYFDRSLPMAPSLDATVMEILKYVRQKLQRDEDAKNDKDGVLNKWKRGKDKLRFDGTQEVSYKGGFHAAEDHSSIWNRTSFKRKALPHTSTPRKNLVSLLSSESAISPNHSGPHLGPSPFSISNGPFTSAVNDDDRLRAISSSTGLRSENHIPLLRPESSSSLLGDRRFSDAEVPSLPLESVRDLDEIKSDESEKGLVWSLDDLSVQGGSDELLFQREKNESDVSLHEGEKDGSDGPLHEEEKGAGALIEQDMPLAIINDDGDGNFRTENSKLVGNRRAKVQTRWVLTRITDFDDETHTYEFMSKCLPPPEPEARSIEGIFVVGPVRKKTD